MGSHGHDAHDKNQRETRLLIYAVSLAFSSFFALALAVYKFVPSDSRLRTIYAEEVSEIAYLTPCLAFGTALLLNTLTLAVERKSVKMRMTLIVCYINLVAAFTDFLGWMDMTPVLRDPWGQGVIITRLIMWLWTTPAMVYLLGLISDMDQQEVMQVVASDAAMLCLLIFALCQPSQLIAVAAIGTAISLYIYSMHGVWQMFQAPINSAGRDTSSVSLQVVRGFTVVMWTGFIVVFMCCKTRLVSVSTEEWLWGIVDFLGKVMFSSSLLQSNFITMEERRLNAMKLVEEGRREQVIQELTSLVQQKQQFMSSMSHELRTPLNGIIGLSDALLIGCCGELSEISHKTISTIKSSGLRLLNLINDILDAASMQHGKLIIRHERVKLDKLVDDVLDLLKPLAKKEVRLINDIPQSMPPVLGDNGRIMQIFHNLIGNSCKFTHLGSIVISAILKMDEVEVSVADTGIGIPREKFDDVFKAFSQVDMSTTRQYGGTGLGLTLVKQLVEAHGGNITVKSKVGVGTTFYMSFKVYDPAIHDEDHPQAMTPTDIEVTKQRVNRMLSILQLKGGSKKSRQVSGDGTVKDGVSKDGAARDSAGKEPKAQSVAGKAIRKSISGPSPGSPRHAKNATVVDPGTPSTRTEVRQTAETLASSTQAPRDNKSGTAAMPSAFDNRFQPQAIKGDDGIERAPSDELEIVVRTDHRHESVVWSSTVAGGAAGQESSTAAGDTHCVVRDEEGASSASMADDDLDATDWAGLFGAPIHVLSIDDDDVNQMVIDRWLSVKGFKITKAMDGMEALDLLNKMDKLPDIILLDVMMPGMSGYEVCRKLRELYPEACVPVIMVSAKSKEEDVVQGLAVGANDYIIKPYSRKEILARIYAHLRYRKQVMKVAAENASTGDPDRSGGVNDDLAELLCVESKAFTLPASIRSKVENSSGVSTPLQVFDDLTMLVIGINNLDALAASRVPMQELLGWLASLFIYLEDLLIQYNAYLVDCMEDRLVIVTGLGGDRLSEQARNALDLAVEVQRLTTTLTPSTSASRLLLSAGIHTCTATAAIVGVQHPVLQVTGALAEKATQLQATCPPGCVHVSKRVLDLCGRPEEFESVTGSKLHLSSEGTYLHQSGAWEAHIDSMSSRLSKYMASHPFGPINSTALRWKPVERAILYLLKMDVNRLVGLMTTPRNRRSRKAVGAAKVYPDPISISAAGEPSIQGAHDNPLAHLDTMESLDADNSQLMDTRELREMSPEKMGLVTKLQLDKEELQRQVEQKATEIDRLQVVVDNLQLDLYGLDTLQTQLNAATGELNKSKSQVVLLQQQLLAAHTSMSKASGPQQSAAQDPFNAVAPSTISSPPSLRTRVAAGSTAQTNSGVLNQKNVTGHSGVPSHSTHVGMGSASHMNTTTIPGSSVAGASHPNTTRTDHRASPEAPVMSISEFLVSLGMPQLAPVFVREEITPDMLPFIADATLLQLGVTSVGDLVRIRRAAQAL